MNVLNQHFEITDIRPVATKRNLIMAAAHLRSSPEGNRVFQTVSACVFNPNTTAALHAVGLFFTRQFTNFKDQPHTQKNQPEAFIYALAQDETPSEKQIDLSHLWGYARLLANLSTHVPSAIIVRIPETVVRRPAFEGTMPVRPTETVVYPLCKIPFGSKPDLIATGLLNDVFQPEVLGFPTDSYLPLAMKSTEALGFPTDSSLPLDMKNTFEAMARRLYRATGPLLPHHRLIDIQPANHL